MMIPASMPSQFRRSNRHFFVVGTDTGVGKTVASLLLMQQLYQLNAHPFYLKPFQTGCPTPQSANSDARFIYSHVRQLIGKDPADSVIYCLTQPKAPLFAGQAEGVAIDIRKIESRIRELKQRFSSLVVEAAGGLMVPVTETDLVVDLVKRFNLQPVLAARAGLGTINHTLLSLEALQARNISPIHVIFIDAGPEPTLQDMIRENSAAVEHFAHTQVLGTIGPITDFSRPTIKDLNIVNKIL